MILRNALKTNFNFLIEDNNQESSEMVITEEIKELLVVVEEEIVVKCETITPIIIIKISVEDHNKDHSSNKLVEEDPAHVEVT